MNACEKTIEKFIRFKNSGSHLDGLRIFVKPTDINPINENTRRKLDQLFLETFPENKKTHVIKELNFFVDSIGIAVKNKIDQEMEEATDRRIKEVVRRDLSPDWKTRLTLSVASDESFFWKTLNSPTISKAYFFESYDKKTSNIIPVSSKLESMI